MKSGSGSSQQFRSQCAFGFHLTHILYVHVHTRAHPPPPSHFVFFRVALICSLISQSPLRLPDRRSTAGVLCESHQHPAHARASEDHQEFHRWKTCSECRKRLRMHLIVMEFSTPAQLPFFLFGLRMKCCLHLNSVIKQINSIYILIKSVTCWM